MRLLFDQNLSPGLPRLLADVYPGSVHVREVALRDSGDSEIWDYAKLNGFIIVSKDSDFQQRSLLYGFPPKFRVFGNKDRKSTRLNSSHTVISYAVFCLKKKKKESR